MIELKHWLQGSIESYVVHKEAGGHMRMGQRLYNDLERDRPDLADRIVGTWDDPFHDDDRIPEFLAVLAYRWDKKL